MTSTRSVRSTAARTAGRVAVVAALAIMATSTVLIGSAGGEVIACGAVITRDTTLSADVGPCPGEGVVIAADGVTLDLNGHTLRGNPEARRGVDKVGIRLQGVTGVTVRGGTVAGFDAGVAIMGGASNTVRGVTARDNVNYRIVTGRNSQPEDIVPDVGPYCDFGDGITVFDSHDNVLEGNNVFGNGPFSGLSLVFDSDDNVVVDNEVHDNDVLNETPDGQGTVCGSTANGPVPDPPPFCCDAFGRHSQGVGVRLEGPGAERNRVQGNDIGRNGLAGVLISGYHLEFGANNGFNLVRANRIHQTGLRVHDSLGDGTEAYRSSGIQLHHSGPEFIHVSYGNLIEGNDSSRNFAAGIEVTGPTPGSGVMGVHGNTIRDNVVDGNALDGIHLAEGTVKTVVSGNRGVGNGRDDQRVEEISDGDIYANWDGVDGGDYNPSCGSNQWSRNRFGSVNQRCAAAEGTGEVEGAGPPGGARGSGMPFLRGRPDGV